MAKYTFFYSFKFIMASTTEEVSLEVKYPQSFNEIRDYIQEIFDAREDSLKEECERDYEISWIITNESEDFEKIRVQKEPTVFVPTRGCISNILDMVAVEALRKLISINDWGSVYSFLFTSLHSEILLAVCEKYSQYHLRDGVTVREVLLNIQKVSNNIFNLPGSISIDADGRKCLTGYKTRFGQIFESENMGIGNKVDWLGMIQ